MVCTAVPRLGYQPKPCLARTMLYAALDCLDAGDTIGCGVRLREAVHRFLAAACEWYDVKPSRRSLHKKHVSPADFARALRQAKFVDEWNYSCLVDMIDMGNKLAHCQAVSMNELRGAISVLFMMMDSEPFCPHERMPIATSHQTNPYDQHDCDDDDGGCGCWEGGAA